MHPGMKDYGDYIMSTGLFLSVFNKACFWHSVREWESVESQAGEEWLMVVI